MDRLLKNQILKITAAFFPDGTQIINTPLRNYIIVQPAGETVYQ